MESLRIVRKKLTDIPDIPNNVTKLNLSFNNIVEIKENIFPPNLQKLCLRDNKIVELKENVFQLIYKN